MRRVFIHGNRSSSNAFDFIRQNIKSQSDILINYDSNNGFYNNLQEMLDFLKKYDEMEIVAHSLGGIYSVHLLKHLPQIKRGLTISTPYGGCCMALGLQLALPFSKVLNDISPISKPIIEAKKQIINVPWVGVVTRSNITNDGVVSVSSQCDRSDISLIDSSEDHFSILESNEILSIMNNFLI